MRRNVVDSVALPPQRRSPNVVILRLRHHAAVIDALRTPHHTAHPPQASAVADDAVTDGAALASAVSAELAAAITSGSLTAAIASAAVDAGSSAFAATRCDLWSRRFA